MAIDEGITARIAAKTRNLLQSVILVGGIGLDHGDVRLAAMGTVGRRLGLRADRASAAAQPAHRAGNPHAHVWRKARGAWRRRAGAADRRGTGAARRPPAMPQLYVIPSPIINAFATGVEVRLASSR